MLVLTRGLAQEIQIGDDIRIGVISIRKGTVRLGIEAPPNVAVHRVENPAGPPVAVLASSQFTEDRFEE